MHEEPFPIPYDCGIFQDGTNVIGGCVKLEWYKWGALNFVIASHLIVGT